MIASTSVAILVVGSEPAGGSLRTTSTSLDGYTCIVDSIVVDPDDKLTTSSLEPGCPTSVEFQTFGPGGTFDAFIDDDGGGGGGDDIVSVDDGSRVTLGYTPPEVLPEALNIIVSLDPHSPGYVCTGGASRGAVGEKTIETMALAGDCSVTLRVAEAVDLATLSFTVDYSKAGGRIPGCDRGARCTFRITESTTFRDYDDASRLEVNAGSALGFSAPVDALRCDFALDDPIVFPSADDFGLTVTSAVGPLPLAKPIDPLPSMEVSVDCPAGSATTTTLPVDAAVCGRPCSEGRAGEPKVRDALYVLSAGVGSSE